MFSVREPRGFEDPTIPVAVSCSMEQDSSHTHNIHAQKTLFTKISSQQFEPLDGCSPIPDLEGTALGSDLSFTQLHINWQWLLAPGPPFYRAEPWGQRESSGHLYSVGYCSGWSKKHPLPLPWPSLDITCLTGFLPCATLTTGMGELRLKEGESLIWPFFIWDAFWAFTLSQRAHIILGKIDNKWTKWINDTGYWKRVGVY